MGDPNGQNQFPAIMNDAKKGEKEKSAYMREGIVL